MKYLRTFEGRKYDIIGAKVGDKVVPIEDLHFGNMGEEFSILGITGLEDRVSKDIVTDVNDYIYVKKAYGKIGKARAHYFEPEVIWYTKKYNL